MQSTSTSHPTQPPIDKGNTATDRCSAQATVTDTTAFTTTPNTFPTEQNNNNTNESPTILLRQQYELIRADRIASDLLYILHSLKEGKEKEEPDVVEVHEIRL